MRIFVVYSFYFYICLVFYLLHCVRRAEPRAHRLRPRKILTATPAHSSRFFRAGLNGLVRERVPHELLSGEPETDKLCQ